MGSNFDKVARLAARQHGRVAWAQLIGAGVDRHTIQRWLGDGRLHRIHDGVYAVGHPGRSLDADYMAAVLAGGEGAILSHFAAAHLLRLLPGRPPPPPEITVASLNGRRRAGIVIHRVAALHRLDTWTLRGIRIATVPRVLLELAPRLERADLGRACHEGWVHHRTGPHHIEACVARNPHKPGVPRLRAAFGSDITLSKLEDGFLELLHKHGLPRPRTNIDRRGDKVDCHWPQRDLTVELLSYRFHASRHAFEADVARRRRSSHIAFTWGDVFERPAQTIRELRSAIRA